MIGNQTLERILLTALSVATAAATARFALGSMIGMPLAHAYGEIIDVLEAAR